MDAETKDRMGATIGGITELLTRLDRMAVRARFSDHCRAKIQAMIFEAVELGQSSMVKGAKKRDGR